MTVNTATISTLIIALVAALHVYFMFLEMVLWTKPMGLKTFGMSAEKAEMTKVLAANQGLYNGFLAAGLVWGLLSSEGFYIKIFFLSCVIIAGFYGGYTVKRSIIYIQALPALIALVLLHFPHH